MVNYRRNRVRGGTFFFTVTLADRHSSLLAEHIDLLRDTVRDVQSQHTFRVKAIVMLPDHLHTVWTLPYNPVKHGLVNRVVDWPFSSFHRYVRLGWVSPDWGGAEMEDREGKLGNRSWIALRSIQATLLFCRIFDREGYPSSTTEKQM